MQTLIVKTDSVAHAKLLLSFFKTVRLVKSVVIEPVVPAPNMAEEQAAAYNWTNPSRPATDEEMEQMISEAEKEVELGLGIPAKVAKKQTMEEIKKWRKKR